ncbi:MAG: DJ-1/PfpI family protein [Rhizomicrobium sp.]
MQVVIPIYEGFDVLDVTGAYEMFRWAGFTNILAAENTGLVTGNGGLTVRVDTSFAAAGRSDILWVPGGSPDAIAAMQKSKCYQDFLIRQAATVKYVTSVCNGALLLAQAGLLNGYTATTHWAFLPCFARFPEVKVAPGNPRFVVDRNRITGGGISSSLDEALEIVKITAGEAKAISVQRTTQYYPDPPVHSQIPVATNLSGAGDLAPANWPCPGFAPHCYSAAQIGDRMLRFVLREAGRLALGLLGAVLLAAAVSALAAPQAGDGSLGFLIAWGRTLAAVLNLDFGRSAMSGNAALEELTAHLPLTLGLVAEGFAVALLVGIPVGLLFGAGPARRAAAPLIQIVSAAPIFCAGLALAFAAANLLHWPVPIAGGVKSGLALWPHSAAAFETLLLPVLTVGLAGAAAAQLALRRAGSESASEPWRVHLRRMGLSPLEIESAYGVPQIFAGLLASLGEVMLALLSAAAVAEWVFNYAGAADLFVKSVALHDWAVVAPILLSFASLTLIADFIGRCAARPLIDRENRHDGERARHSVGAGPAARRRLGRARPDRGGGEPFGLPRQRPGRCDRDRPWLAPPSAALRFGTDILGRDILSETLHGLSATVRSACRDR